MVIKVLSQEEYKMGFLDKIMGRGKQSQPKLNAAEAFTAIALMAIAADGQANEAEMQALKTALSQIQLFMSYSNDAKKKMIDRLLNMVDKNGVDVMLKAAISSIPDEVKETSFTVATEIVVADGKITTEEEKFLNDLYPALNISEEIAVKIRNDILNKK